MLFAKVYDIYVGDKYDFYTCINTRKKDDKYYKELIELRVDKNISPIEILKIPRPFKIGYELKKGVGVSKIEYIKEK